MLKNPIIFNNHPNNLILFRNRSYMKPKKKNREEDSKENGGEEEKR